MNILVSSYGTDKNFDTKDKDVGRERKPVSFASKLIPKKKPCQTFLKNWRPIVLLNTDYKIASKAINNTLKTVVPKIIDNDQTGFLKRPSVGEKILD